MMLRTLVDGWRFATGTLTAIPVRPASALDPAVARAALLLAPVAVLPLGLLVTAVLTGGSRLGLPPLATGFVAVGALALGSRALHLDGLADLADGLTASYDRERSLAVMRTGTSGPAGVTAVVVTLGIQAACLAALSAYGVRGAVLAGLAVCASRAALWIACARPVPAARPEGLGVVLASRLPVAVAALGWLLLAGIAMLLHPWQDPLVVLVAVAVAAAAVVLATRRAVRRLGGVTGDVFGACIEIALAVLLVGLVSAT